VTHETARTSAPDDAPVDGMPPWHALEVAEALTALGTDPDRGLSGREATARLGRHGPNALGREEPRGRLEVLLAQFRSPLIYILVVAAAITVAIGEYADTVVIVAVLAINTVIGYVQEHKADHAVHALLGLTAPRATVVRDGVEQEVDAAELVPGDVVLLASGTLIPADLRLVGCTALEVDESLLTGESTPARKRTDPVHATALVADRASTALMGCAVARGRGRGVVTATGEATELGAIAQSIRRERRPRTPMQDRMRRFANVIAVAVLGSTLVAFLLGVTFGEPLDTMFLTAVALAVAVVPEGLPIAYTVAMTLGVHRMAQRNAILRSLGAVETLGSTDTIGSDKTGTLTANRMTVLRAWTVDGWVSFHQDGEDVLGDDLPDAQAHLAERPGGALARTMRNAIASSEAALVTHGDEILEHRGEPTETALLEAGHRLGLYATSRTAPAGVLAFVPFESDLRYSYVVVDEDGPVLRLKGAPERVLELCSGTLDRGGTRDVDGDEALLAAEAMARRGLRVLAMAERRLESAAHRVSAQRPPAPDGLVLTGLIGMQDPPRPHVRAAIDRCRRAGIRVIMLTGDHAATARAIAEDLGMSATAAVLTGADLEEMDEEALRAAVLEVDVFARVAPEHKLRVVRALRSHEQVVAVTGDGVNDGPALKAADVGVAMGRAGTDVAREASDMVLTDDHFASITNAVEEGRVVFDNTRKVTYFLLSTGAAAIVAIIASIVAGLPLPYVPAALLWLNVVTNGLQDVALAFEKGEPDVLERPPRHRDEGIVSGVLWERAALTGVTMAVGSLWVFTWAIDAGLSSGQQRGAALTTLVLAMAAHVYNARSDRRSIVVTNVRGNRFLLISTLVALTVHVLAGYWGPTQRLLQVAPVTGAGWIRILVVAVAVIGVSELHKALRSRPGRRGRPPTRPAGSPARRRERG
jgi:magnesium-transporting ATPase (P-type)